MKIDNINSLVELYFKKYDEIKDKKNLPFLFGLSSKNENFSLSWNEVTSKIRCLTTFLQDYISPGDRCILLSENRPQWLIADIAIMNSGGVTVPLFTTYSNSDYEYIINDCEPKVCIVSNKLQYEKIEKFLNKNIKIISIDEINQCARYESILQKCIRRTHELELWVLHSILGSCSGALGGPQIEIWAWCSKFSGTDTH